MEVIIELPQSKDFKNVNELAKQVQELHVQWRPDLFLSVENVISQEEYERLVENNEIVDQKYRGKGIGTTLLKYARKIGKVKNIAYSMKI